MWTNRLETDRLQVKIYCCAEKQKFASRVTKARMQTRSQYLIHTDLLGDNGSAKTCHRVNITFQLHGVTCTTCLHPFLLGLFRVF